VAAGGSIAFGNNIARYQKGNTAFLRPLDKGAVLTPPAKLLLLSGNFYSPV